MSKENRNRLIFTALILAVFCIGSSIPVAGVDKETLSQIFTNENSGLFDLYNLFTGGSFQNFTLFALGITPYITASIIIQLLTIAFTYFENLSKEGEAGRKKMAAITRYFTIALALLQAAGITFGLFRQAIIDKSVLSIIVILMTLTAGTTILMWLGEQINEYGVGNGMSILIFAGIVMRLPVQVKDIISQAKDGTLSWVAVAGITVGAVALVAIVIYIQGGVRKIPVQYAKKISDRRVYSGTSTYIPIKLNASGVIPIIFAVSILQLPITIAYFVPQSKYADFVGKYLSPSGSVGMWVYMGLDILLIIAFTFFYTAIVFNPEDVANNLKNNGGTIPAIRPGTPTIEYLANVSKRMCLLDGLFLAAIATLPTMISSFTPLNMSFGGTSLLILIGVAMDTVNQMKNREMFREAQNRGFLI